MLLLIFVLKLEAQQLSQKVLKKNTELIRQLLYSFLTRSEKFQYFSKNQYGIQERQQIIY